LPKNCSFERFVEASRLNPSADFGEPRFAVLRVVNEFVLFDCGGDAFLQLVVVDELLIVVKRYRESRRDGNLRQARVNQLAKVGPLAPNRRASLARWDLRSASTA